MKIKGAIIILSILISKILIAQDDKINFLKGFGIEIGAGYNTLIYKYSGIGRPETYSISRLGEVVYLPATPDNRTDRVNDFWIQPTGRLIYSFTLKQFSDSLKFKIPIFIGYYTFGGARTNVVSIPENPISKEVLLFRSIEYGINPCVDFRRIKIGLLLKTEYIFSASARTYGSPEWINGNPIYETDISNDYKKISLTTGVNFKYKIKRFSIALETVFGISNLNKNTKYGEKGKLEIFENNYRLLLGYEF